MWFSLNYIVKLIKLSSFYVRLERALCFAYTDRDYTEIRYDCLYIMIDAPIKTLELNHDPMIKFFIIHFHIKIPFVPKCIWNISWCSKWRLWNREIVSWNSTVTIKQTVHSNFPLQIPLTDLYTCNEEICEYFTCGIFFQLTYSTTRSTISQWTRATVSRRSSWILTIVSVARANLWQMWTWSSTGGSDRDCSYPRACSTCST